MFILKLKLYNKNINNFSFIYKYNIIKKIINKLLKFNLKLIIKYN
jgi:hypothetical protein